jgi:hypothetical protein
VRTVCAERAAGSSVGSELAPGYFAAR